MLTRLKELFRGVREPVNSPRALGKKWTDFEDVKPTLKGGVFVCPNCHGDKFYEGPSGGVSTNIECVECHLRWNSNHYGFPWQYIGKAEGK
jgi:hypothetical protein